MKDGKKVVITYGTFDLFHQGHYNILKRAKELGDYLIVGVTGETYDLERGKLSVCDSLVERIENVKKTGFADLIIVEEFLGQKIQDIIKYNVDVLVVGSDWKGKFDHMRKYCEVCYLERTRDISSTLIRETARKIYSLGVVTSTMEDDDVIYESKFVSGIHAESVYCEDEKLAGNFCEKFELDSFYTDYDAFLETLDMIYVSSSCENKYELIKSAMEKGKIVLSSPKLSKDPEEVRELYEYAEKHDRLLIECIPTFYLQAFDQLLWNAKGNLIGDIVCVKTSIALGKLTGIEKADVKGHIYFSLLVAEKFFGSGMKYTVTDMKQASHGFVLGETTDAESKGVFICEIGKSGNVGSKMEIIGTTGKIVVPAEWWNTGHFELHSSRSSTKRYSWNFDGNGLRYIIMATLTSAKSEGYSKKRVTLEPAVAAIEIIEK